MAMELGRFPKAFREDLKIVNIRPGKRAMGSGMSAISIYQSNQD